MPQARVQVLLSTLHGYHHFPSSVDDRCNKYQDDKSALDDSGLVTMYMLLSNEVTGP